MSIPSLSVILLKMTLVNIIVIFVKKNATQSIGSTIVQIAIILHIPNVFLGKTQISSNIYNGHLPEVLTHLFVTYTTLISLRKSKATLNVIDAILLAKI